MDNKCNKIDVLSQHIRKITLDNSKLWATRSRSFRKITANVDGIAEQDIALRNFGGISPSYQSRNGLTLKIGSIGKNIRTKLWTPRDVKRTASMKETTLNGNYFSTNNKEKYFSTEDKIQEKDIISNEEITGQRSFRLNIEEPEGAERPLKIELKAEHDNTQRQAEVNIMEFNEDLKAKKKLHSRNNSISIMRMNRMGGKQDNSSEITRERLRNDELQLLLEIKRTQRNLMDQCLSSQQEELDNLRRNYEKEKAKRVEMEHQLQLQKQRSLGQEEKNQEKNKENRKSSTTNESKEETWKRQTWPCKSSSRCSQWSCHADGVNLLDHLNSLGHLIEHCPHVIVTQDTCRGFLRKLGKSKFRSFWKTKWFVFDLKNRALCYYSDDTSSKADGIIYFQSIQEVYVDNSLNDSSAAKSKFCVKTPTRLYILAAPTAVTMGIWIDVVCTGKECPVNVKGF